MAQIIGDYELLERIGAGGMGEVWRAANIHTRVGCAVKLLPSEATADRTFVARFFDEGRLMQTLDHPRIVRVHHVGHDTASGRHFLVMDYVAGPNNKACSLHDLLEQSPERRLQEAEVRRWAREVAEALACAHGQGVVHRDIKPANVLLDREGHVRVADFGLAKAVGEEWIQSQFHTSVARSLGSMKTFSSHNCAERSLGDEKTVGSERPSSPRSSGEALLGTYDYMAPEQRGDLEAPISPATDVYAFGVMVYRLLTGRRPTGMTKPVSQVVPGLSTDWDALLARCLEHEPNDRFADGDALLEALVGESSPKVLTSGSSKVKGSKAWLWLAGAAALAALSFVSLRSLQSHKAALAAQRAASEQAAKLGAAQREKAAALEAAQRVKAEQSRLAAENEKSRKQQSEDARLAEEKRKQEALSAEQARLTAEDKKVTDDRKLLEDEKAALAEAGRIERERKAKQEAEIIDASGGITNDVVWNSTAQELTRFFIAVPLPAEVNNLEIYDRDMYARRQASMLILNLLKKQAEYKLSANWDQVVYNALRTSRVRVDRKESGEKTYVYEYP